MARGGARVNSGPPPDPNALRRDRPSDQAGWTTLPAEGRKGRVPAWPLAPDVRLTSQLDLIERDMEILSAQMEADRAPRGAVAKLAKLDQQAALLKARIKSMTVMEKDLWKSLWGTPQAVMWDRLRWTREVALYTRWQVQAELGDMDAAKEARQWSDRLGLNPTALLRNRWKIADSAAAGSAPAPRRTTSSSRGRLKVVTGGGS